MVDALRRVARGAAALAVAFAGGVVIYGFGAGYLSRGLGVLPPLWLPNPFNVVATIVLGSALIVLVLRIAGFKQRRLRSATSSDTDRVPR